jgi:plastocyanin
MTPMRRLAAALVASFVVLAISASLALAQTSNAAVSIGDFQFTPATLQVTQGTTVTWTNNGPANHTTTSDTGVWDSGVLQAGRSFSFRFNAPGTFAYHCTIHPAMKGTITVTAAAASAAASPSPSAAAPAPSPCSSPAATQASPSSSPSRAATPAQLPKTGAGGGQVSGMPWLLAVAPLGALGLWVLVRRWRSQLR